MGEKTRRLFRASTRWFPAFCILFAVFSAALACPSACECKWKGGKQTVECRNRGLITLPSNIDPETQVLDLSGNNLQILPREAFLRANLLNLQKIYLQGCRIGQMDSTALRGLSNLVELDLSDNLLTSVPSEAFRDAPSLRELRLNANPIQKIDDRTFEFLPGLVKLDLSDCQIESMSPGSFEGLEQLSHLRLGNNRLTEIKPRVVSSLTRLHGVELHNNPWVCDCRLRYTREWLQQYNIPTPVSPTCASPLRLSGKPLMELQLDEFACPPEMMAPSPGYPRHVDAFAGDNATLSCRVAAVPSPDITWLWRGQPMVNSSIISETGRPSNERLIIILEEGTFEKISHLILSPARESDSGDFICVADNRAGLAQTNFSLRVDAKAPVAGGLGSAQIAGLGAGLVLLLALLLVVFLVVIINYRQNSSKADRKEPPPAVNSEMANGIIAELRSPSDSRVNSNILHSNSAATSPTAKNPDLIHEARKASDFWYHNAEVSGTSPYGGVIKNQNARDYSDPSNDIVVRMVTSDGDYQSAQTDSLYPSALWPRTGVETDEAITTCPSNVLDNSYTERATLPLSHPVLIGGNGGDIQGYSAVDSETESITFDSYSLPRRMGHEPIYAGFVPYPPDYGLPRNATNIHLGATTQHNCPQTATIARHVTAAENSASSLYESRRGSASVSIESSPASSAKSPRFWHRANGTTKRHFARDSPDEGYQEECATDV